MSKHLALPREGHLEQVLHIVGYLKEHKKLRLLFDLSYPKTQDLSTDTLFSVNFMGFNFHSFILAFDLGQSFPMTPNSEH